MQNCPHVFLATLAVSANLGVSSVLYVYGLEWMVRCILLDRPKVSGAKCASTVFLEVLSSILSAFTVPSTR